MSLGHYIQCHHGNGCPHSCGLHLEATPCREIRRDVSDSADGVSHLLLLCLAAIIQLICYQSVAQLKVPATLCTTWRKWYLALHLLIDFDTRMHVLPCRMHLC